MAVPGGNRVASLAGFLLSLMATDVSAQTGLTYRFQADTLAGRMWVLGNDARRQLEAGENGLAAGRIEIWKDGGRQIFILNPSDRTYYEQNAWRLKRGMAAAAVDTLTAREPFRVSGVDNVRADLRLMPGTETVSGYPCRRAILTFSYRLALRVANASGTMPAAVEGTHDICVTEQRGALPLPFGHHVAFTSGHAEVDTAIAERLAGLKGIPVARLLKATRRIENGEPVSATSALLLTDILEERIPADLFEIPKDYRFQEPEIVGPVRRDGIPARTGRY